VENVWFKKLVLHLCRQVVFPFRKQISHEILLNLVEKMKQVPKLANCISINKSFNLWMSKGAHNIFALVINLLGFDWYLKQVTIGLFEATKIIDQALANNLTIFLDQYV
jgi:hypothetical protein